MVQEIDPKDPKAKQMLKRLQRALLGSDDSGVKRYILYSSDPDSKNFKFFKDFSSKLDFELPSTGEKFGLTESAIELNGIETYVLQRDRTDAMKFELITGLVKNQTNPEGIEVIPTGTIRKMIKEFEEESLTNSKSKAKKIPRELLEDLLSKNKKVIEINSLKKLLKEHSEKQPINPCIPINRLPMDQVRKSEKETREIFEIKEKLRSPSEIFHLHHGIAMRRKHPQPKFNFEASMYLLLTNIITGLIVGFICYSIFYTGE